MTTSVMRFALLVAALAGALPALAAPRVVVTIAPIHSLVSSVTAGVIEPYLLLPAGASPHTFSMRPSQMRALQGADLVVWVGEALETFLLRALTSAAKGGRVMEVMALPGVTLDPWRDGDDFEAHDHDEHDPAAGHAEDRPGANPHVWLDPANAAVIVREVAAALAALDAPNARRYRENAAATVARIEALDAALARDLAPVRDVPFVVFHDAYQGFERRYGLRAVGVVAVSPARPPGASRLLALRETIVRLGARCVFSEPQFEPRIVETIVEGTRARSALLDPLGAGLEPGPDAWFALTRGLARSLRACLLAE